MASDISFVEYATEQMSGAGTIRYRKMFGDYAVYCNEKVVALICDTQLFIKPTDAGRAFAGQIEEAEPYPGAKPYLLVGDRIDDADWLAELVRRTAAALPVPRKKSRNKRKS